MSDTLEGREKARFPTLLIFGVLMALAVVIVAFVVDTDYGIPVLLLTVICAIAAIGYRVIAGRSGGGAGGGDADSTDGGIPTQESRSDRPLGDTPDAHDELNPHDLPLSNPGRHEAEKMASGVEGTTSGHAEGGAAGHGESTERVGTDEAKGGARTT
jgi:hypothetical protein